MSRFFFAIKPDHEIREHIISVRDKAQLSGHLTPIQNIHLTLLFLGKVTKPQQKNMITLAKQIKCPEFELVLNQPGYFKNSQVSWLGPGSIPEAFLMLHKKLHSNAIDNNLLMKPQAYKPHITLARKSSPIGKKTMTDIKWRVNEFALFESLDTTHGVVYKTIQNFLLH